MEIKDLISEMQKVKLEYPTRSIDEILQLFNIQALQNLTNQMRRLGNK